MGVPKRGTASILGLGICLWFGATPTTAASANSRVEWLRRSVVALPTPGTDLDAGARDALLQAFSGTDLVLLGEATRGDGTTFLAKTQLVGWLFEELGFDVLVFEGGFFDCRRAWQGILDGRAARDALRGALFPLYVDSRQFQPLLDLVELNASTDHPLRVVGIDSGLDPAGVDELFAGLAEILALCGTDPASVEDLDLLRQIVGNVASGSYSSGELAMPRADDRRRVDRVLKLVSELLSCPHPARDSSGLTDLDFWRQVVVNLRWITELTWDLGQWSPRQAMDPAIHNQRDRHMAENLLWLRRHAYPGRKMIVWSLSLHLARDLDRLETGELTIRRRLTRFHLLGEHLAAALEPDPFVVVYTAFAGQKGSLFRTPHDLQTPTRGSLEDLMGRTGIDHAFLDLGRLSARDGGGWLQQPLIARPLTFIELRGVWPQHVDAFVFLRTMQAVQEVPR